MFWRRERPWLRYPSNDMDGQERAAWLDHQRDRWNAWAETLSRIKQDEQRWLSVAVLVYGSVIGLLATKGHAAFLGPIHEGGAGVGTCGVQCLGVLLPVFVVAHGFAWVWLEHALTLRVQYYRSMSRVLRAQLALGGRVPRDWLCEDAEQWRKEATAPWDSKGGEVLVLGLLVLVTTAVPAVQCVPSLRALEMPGWWYFLAGLLLLGLPFAWLLIYYPARDRRRMARLHAATHMRELRCAGRRRARLQSVGFYHE